MKPEKSQNVRERQRKEEEKEINDIWATSDW
jgi:hypothetical protein